MCSNTLTPSGSVVKKGSAMFTNFAPRHTMFAHELAHSTFAPLPLHMAFLIAGELGEPSYRHKNDSAWYADAHIDLDDGVQISAPLALRIDRNGNASVQCRWEERDLISHAIASLVPDIEIDVRPRGTRRAA